MSKVTLDDEHVYRVDGIRRPGVNELLKGVGLIDFPETTLLMEAARRGTAVHRACELYDRGTLDWKALDPVIEGHVTQYAEFRRITGFTPRLSEAMFYAEPFGYCGTLDLEGDLGPDPCVIDLKSVMTPHAPMRSVGYALAGYEIGVRWCDLTPWGTLSDRLARPRKRYALTLWPKNHRLHEYTDPRDRQVFFAALEIWNAKAGATHLGETRWTNRL